MFPVQVEGDVQRMLIGSGAHHEVISYYPAGGSNEGYSVGKQRLLIFIQTKSNQMVVVGGKIEVAHFPKKSSISVHSRNRDFTQNDLFPKLAQLGETLALLFSAEIITHKKRKAVDSFLVAAGTRRIPGPGSFTSALSWEWLYFLICKGHLLPGQ